MDSRAAYETALDLARRIDTKYESWTYWLEDREDSSWALELLGNVIALVGDADVLYICGAPKADAEGGHEVGADLILVTASAVIVGSIERVQLNSGFRHDCSVVARPRGDIAAIALIGASGINTAADVPWPAVIIARLEFADGTSLMLPNSKNPKTAPPDGLRELVPALVGEL
ncbi:MAG: hypothetical protein JWP19_2470 [Rhodoglobus sp.]|nr:hypothetical protein [Rhodoglobus sp.]